MKICAIICEFNPFHNGHKYLLDTARRLSGCDAVLCIMSGNFTQRGDMCILDKYARARHAVQGGADCVIELPAAFAVAPAEIFAKGAIKILSAIPEVCALAFGCESGEKADFINAAEILKTESTAFKNVLTENLDRGESYIKSYSAAFAECGGKGNLLESPNNVLGVEYTKAILQANSKIEILPVKRTGSGYNDGEIKENFSSASAIRSNLNSPLIKSNLPEYVYSELKNAVNTSSFESIQKYAVLSQDKQNIARVTGCSEGLENKLQTLSDLPLSEIINEATGKRYSSARIRRILTANALGLYEDDCKEFLNSDLYVKPLALKKDGKDELFKVLGGSVYPVVIRQRDTSALTESAKKCLERDVFASKVWSVACNRKIYDFTVTTV